MDTDVLVPAETGFDAFLRQPQQTARCAMSWSSAITESLGCCASIRDCAGASRRPRPASLSARWRSRDFTIAREDDIAFDVIERMWRKGGAMAVVVAGKGVPNGADVRGIISKEHIADSVADSVKGYA